VEIFEGEWFFWVVWGSKESGDGWSDGLFNGSGLFEALTLSLGSGEFWGCDWIGLF
jgi:hypothetical protein